MNELTLDGKIYVSSKHAAEITGYAKDYVGQMCREGRIEARLVGRNWYVLKSGLEKHRFLAQSEVKVPENPLKSTPVEVWESPRYESEARIDLPSINKLAEEALPEQINSSGSMISTIEAMQDAWKGWFGGNPNGSLEEATLSEAEIGAAEDETLITIHTLNRRGSHEEALNLRRIREYRAEQSDPEPRVINEVIHFRTIPNYFLRTIFLILIVVVLAVGYVGSGFLSQSIASRTPFSLFAGVFTYNYSK